MRKLMYLIIVIVALGLIIAGCIPVVPPTEQGVADDKAPKEKCATIQGGTLYASTGELLTTGFDEFGYNYQAHQYIGYYGNYQRPPDPVDWGYRLMMKWNDAWMSNKDCDLDGKLDRHFGYDTFIGSGAWLTNHQSGEDVIEGEICKWNYFVKIVAAPADAYTDYKDAVLYWYTADDIEIGEVIWGQFAIVQQVENDACAGLHGLQYLSPASPGFGKY